MTAAGELNAMLPLLPDGQVWNVSPGTRRLIVTGWVVELVVSRYNTTVTPRVLMASETVDFSTGLSLPEVMSMVASTAWHLMNTTALDLTPLTGDYQGAIA